MTDTQSTHMVGCYSGNPKVGTPNIDQLASEGIRFDRAYTTCPLCTPARSALFSGVHPPVNGAWANSMAPGLNFPLMGTIFSEVGYECGYSGKWHLDGTAYFGDGVAGGGFPQDWWFDGKNYADFLGPDKFQTYLKAKTSDELRNGGFTENDVWGKQVADRTIDFLKQQKGRSNPFLFVASFDEPHGPYVCPPGEWENYDSQQIPVPENFQASLDGKPELQKIHGNQVPQLSESEHRESLRRHYACNQYVDRQIGRILDVINQDHADDTIVIYTSDHGDMQRSHGLRQKGPMMYEEVSRIPFIVRIPGSAIGMNCNQLVSHLDLIPTLLELCEQPIPQILQGQSFLQQLHQPETPGRKHLMLSHTRFALNHDGWGGFYPVRCLITQNEKLVINLVDTDEFYLREESKNETFNLIEADKHRTKRDELHDQLLAEMDRTRDPFRSADWVNRSWRSNSRTKDYYGGERRYRPSVFPFQPDCLDADGTRSSSK